MVVFWLVVNFFADSRHIPFMIVPFLFEVELQKFSLRFTNIRTTFPNPWEWHAILAPSFFQPTFKKDGRSFRKGIWWIGMGNGNFFFFSKTPEKSAKVNITWDFFQNIFFHTWPRSIAMVKYTQWGFTSLTGQPPLLPMSLSLKSLRYGSKRVWQKNGMGKFAWLSMAWKFCATCAALRIGSQKKKSCFFCRIRVL